MEADNKYGEAVDVGRKRRAPRARGCWLTVEPHPSVATTLHSRAGLMCEVAWLSHCTAGRACLRHRCQTPGL
ncbi:unnamed protein product [Ectocarpus sp. CCAP 1310/34]|nr:unnamed protein product [Ectocarpus sp. CCAP 1310/34]